MNKETNDSLKTIQNFAFLPVDEDADREIDKYIKNVYPSRKIFINPANRNKNEKNEIEIEIVQNALKRIKNLTDEEFLEIKNLTDEEFLEHFINSANRNMNENNE